MYKTHFLHSFFPPNKIIKLFRWRCVFRHVFFSFTLKIQTGCLNDPPACSVLECMAQQEWRGELLANLRDLETVDILFSGDHAETLKWDHLRTCGPPSLLHWWKRAERLPGTAAVVGFINISLGLTTTPELCFVGHKTLKQTVLHVVRQWLRKVQWT